MIGIDADKHQPHLSNAHERRIAQVKVWLARCATQYNKGVTPPAPGILLQPLSADFSPLLSVEDVLHVLLEGKITETAKERAFCEHK
jgi:hypothetical protein